MKITLGDIEIDFDGVCSEISVSHDAKKLKISSAVPVLQNNIPFVQDWGTTRPTGVLSVTNPCGEVFETHTSGFVTIADEETTHKHESADEASTISLKAVNTSPATTNVGFEGRVSVKPTSDSFGARVYTKRPDVTLRNGRLSSIVND